jgi:hypothetical protein
MNRSPRSARTSSSLSDSIHQRLNMYALTASAAGVGMLALSPSAEAKIIYTPAHVHIEIGQTVPLDLNHDGKADFSFQNYSNTFEGSEQGFLFIFPAKSHNGVDSDTTYPRALALPSGKQVGAKAPWLSVHYISMVSADAAERCFGSWNNVKNRYLGLKFMIKGKTHFGWARLNVSCNSTNNKIKALLTGYAYETVPNTPIVTGKTKGPDEMSDAGQLNPADVGSPAGESATLGLLAMGSPALSIWRRDESAEAKQ